MSRSGNSWIGSLRDATSARALVAICATYLLLAGTFASVNLDTDEFTFIREPYEILGGDYTSEYIRQGEYAKALETAGKAYYFYWKYRPLFSPIIAERDKDLFLEEERRFGYVRPERVDKGDTSAALKYRKRLIVPEPDRFYTHGAGKPLLPALVSIPQLAIAQFLVSGGRQVLLLQHTRNYHLLFVVLRAVQLLAGLAAILLVFRLLSTTCDSRRALLGTAIFAVFPTTVKYFPNLHHDAILVPAAILAASLFAKERYVVAGIWFGIALASKNTAIFLFPAFIAFLVWARYEKKPSSSSLDSYRPVVTDLRALAIVVLIGCAILLLFAHPVSYFEEIATPVTGRAYDVRGEDVSRFTLADRLGPDAQGVTSSMVRPEIRLGHLTAHLNSTAFLFLALSLVAIFAKSPKGVVRLSALLVVLLLPFGLVFGHDLNYRVLMFLPFWIILCVEVGDRRILSVFLVIIAMVTCAYCVDPITTDRIHHPGNTDTLYDAVRRLF